MGDTTYADDQNPPSLYADAQNPPSPYVNKNSQVPAQPAQPAGGSPAPKPAPPAPKDVVLILSPDSEKADAVTEAAVIAPDGQILFANSLQDMVNKLKSLKAPVRTLFLLGHSTAEGDIAFETPGKPGKPGKVEFVRAETIAQRVKGIVQVENIDFHGCAVAVSPREMDKVRTALNATKARGSTCELVRQVAGPIKGPGKKPITDRATFDLSNAVNRKLFDAGLKMLRDSFGDDRKKCIINDTEDGYFQAHGKLIAVWANPESIAGNNAFDKSKSICYNDLKLEQVDPSKDPVIDENQCKLIVLG
jgi:hypothetical protein